MFVKFFLALLLAVTSQFGLVAAQNELRQKPDFSGKWSLESRNGTKVIGNDATIIISQTGPQIKIQEFPQSGTSHKTELTYYTDGRGETNPSESTGKPLHSITRWKKSAFVIKFSLPSTRANNNVMVNERVDEWTISKDGQTLTRTSSFTSSPSTTDAGNNPYGSPRSLNPLKTPLKWKEKKSYKRV